MFSQARFFVFYSAFLLLAACSSSSSSSVSTHFQQSAVIGGDIVTIPQGFTRSVVAVYDSLNKSLCSGTLLANHLVLTAAHCIQPNRDLLVVFANNLTASRDTSLPMLANEVDGVELPPSWTTTGGVGMDRGDLALIHFVGDVPAAYEAATLAPAEFLLQAGDIVNVAGYGVNDARNSKSNGILRTAAVLVQDSLYGSSEFVLDQTQGRGVCRGDSGGPAFISVGKDFYLLGVTSRGLNDRDDDCSQSGILTNVQKYSSWIQEAGERLGPAGVKPELEKGAGANTAPLATQ